MLRPREALAAAAVLLLLSAAVMHEPAESRVTELAAQGLGLEQGAAGLRLAAPQPRFDVVRGRDARLADQIAHWDGSTAVAAGFVPAAGTEQLAQVPARSDRASALSRKIHTAVNSLRLADFLTGVKPKVTEAHVRALYAKMDPHDTTGWMGREHLQQASSAQAQRRRFKTYESLLHQELSTTKEQDSPQAQKVRRELRELIKRKAAVRRSINAQMRRELHHTSSRVWTSRAAARRGDSSDFLIRQIAQPEDQHASYTQWLRSAESGRSRRHGVWRPRVTAGGELDWRHKVHSQLETKHARLQKLSLIDTVPSRLESLSESDDNVGASEIAMREILGGATKASHRYVDALPQAELAKKKPKGVLAVHQQLHSTPALATNTDLLTDAAVGVEPRHDSGESIQERAAYKVYRWMGGGYDDEVYDGR